MILFRRYKKCILLLSLVFLPAISCLYAQPLNNPKENLSNERKQFEQDIALIEKSLKSIESSQIAGLNELTLIEAKIKQRRRLVNNIDKQIDTLQKEINEKQQTIKMLQDELKRIKESYASLLVQYYNMRNKEDWMMYIMASESVAQAYKRTRYFRDILYLLQAQANEIITMSNLLNNEITDVARKQQRLEDDKTDKDKEVNNLETEEKKSKTVLSNLQRKEAKLRKELQEKKESFDQLNKSLSSIYRNELESGMDISAGDMPLITERFEASKGYLPWPAIGTIVSKFGKHFHPYYENIELPENKGIDIQTAKNAEVYAIFGGKVTQIIEMPKTGEKTIIIRHGAYTSVYFRVDKIFVKKGDDIKSRQRIATVANTSEGSVLHLEIRKTSGKRNMELNPEHWLLK